MNTIPIKLLVRDVKTASEQMHAFAVDSHNELLAVQIYWRIHHQLCETCRRKFRLESDRVCGTCLAEAKANNT